MKLSVNDLKNITPTGVNIELSYEKDYSGTEEKIELRVYPLTVEEKILLQEKSDKLNQLLKLKDRSDEQEKELITLNDDINLEYAYLTTKKVISDITRDFIKSNFPKKWYAQIFKATLEAEGINPDDIEKEKN